ncbi:MAG: YciI-like protein [Bacteroidota bacterium]
MYYILFYKTVDNYIEKRGSFREAHLKLAKEYHARGELILAGALADPADGAILVFKGDSPAVAENFAKSDPYVLNGLIKEWSVR